MKSNTYRWVLGAVLLVVLAGAAFLAARLISLGPQAWSGVFGPSGGRIRIEVNRSGELPQRNPTLDGQVIRADGNSVFIQGMRDNSDRVDGNSPTTEVVVSRETRVYRDATLDDQSRAPATNQTLDQVLEKSAVNQIQRGMMLMAWGERRGDRLMAEVVVYMNPPVYKKIPNP
ncbi:MAG TPA: hypothetical protein VMT46_14515 [Anaerolineaceae bacterium]|nr:hypothetical protein [Anaerolineaceae bacterium]